MPIKVTGTTDASGALSVGTPTTKKVCIVGKGGTTPSASTDTVFLVSGVTDAKDKWGSDADAPELVDFLIKNGATNIVGIRPADPATDGVAEYTAALTASLTDRDIDIIILDNTDPALQALLEPHLTVAEGEDLYRYAVVGAPAGTDLAGMATLAGTFGSKRIFLPGVELVDSSNVAVDNMNLAAAFAGIMSSETDDPALPLFGVRLQGFGGVKDVYLTSEYDTLVNAGVTPIKLDESGYVSIYRAVSTYTTDTVWTELTTVMIADIVLADNIFLIKNKFKRTKNVTRILAAYRTAIIAEMQRKESLEIIENFDVDSVVVTKSISDPYGADIAYTFDVVTPLYNVTITQSMII